MSRTRDGCLIYDSGDCVALCRCKWILDGQGEPHLFPAKDQQQIVSTVIEPMASNGMRTICIAYKDYLPGECC